MALIDLAGLTVIRNGSPILQDVSLRVEPSEIITIVGPNGSGKSTLLRSIIGAIRPDKGTIRRQPGLRIGYVPQSITIDPALPISVARFMDLPTRRARPEVAAALETAGVAALADRPLRALSGGQLQRVLLARALIGAPQLLLLDEPTTGLDQPGSADFYRRIEVLRSTTGCAVVMVSHELHVVMSASDRVICLNGHVCCHGTPDVVASAPEYRALFGRGTHGALALYRHEHDHAHDGSCHHDHDHGTAHAP